jgi:hypothetical protein
MVNITVVRVKAPDAGGAATALEVDRVDVTAVTGDAAKDVGSVLAACVPEGFDASALELQNYAEGLRRAEAAKASAKEARKREGLPEETAASTHDDKTPDAPPHYTGKLFARPSASFPLLPVASDKLKPLDGVPAIEASTGVAAAVLCRYPVGAIAIASMEGNFREDSFGGLFD